MRTSATLSKLPSAVSSPGKSDFTSTLRGSSANKSKIARLYSVRLRRWTALIRPGFGFAAHARSMSASRVPTSWWRSPYLAEDVRVAASSRHEAMHAPYTSGLALGFVTSNVSSASPAVRSLWLWQVMQYLSRTAWDAEDPAGAAAVCWAEVGTGRAAALATEEECEERRPLHSRASSENLPSPVPNCVHAPGPNPGSF